MVSALIKVLLVLGIICILPIAIFALILALLIILALLTGKPINITITKKK